MDFEELQVIWNSQNNEKMYVVNEGALHDYIKRKGRSINHTVNFFELILVSVNLFVGIWLTVESLDNNPWSNQLILAVFYLAFAVYGFIRRLVRRNEEKPFDSTILGELDRSLWRIDYLMQQGRFMLNWFLVPLTVMLGIMSLFDNRILLAFGMMVVVVIATYFGYRWEVRKIHQPKKRNLETLREKLTDKED